MNCRGIQHKQPLPKIQGFRIRTDYSCPIKTTTTEKIAKGQKFPQCFWCNSDISILLLFSFYQEPIHKNNSWKHKPAYYPLLYITKWLGFLYFVLVFYCEVGLTFFLPPPSHPPSPPPPNKKLIISIKRLICLWKKTRK